MIAPPEGISSTWAIVAIVVIPLLIVFAAEVDERTRQRRSPLRRAVLIIRNWVLPSFAAWTILAVLIDLDRTSIPVRLASSILILSVSAAALRAIAVAIDLVRRRRRAEGGREPAQLLLALPRLVTILLAFWLLVDSVWGVDLSAALTALGVTSLVVSFALQDTLSGLASGLLLLSDRPFAPGDWISAGDVEGEVIDIRYRTSRILDRNGDMIIVPNNELASGSIINFSSPDRLHRVVVPVQVAFVNPPTLAKAMLFDAAVGTAGVLADPRPSVRVVQIDDPLMGYEVHMWVDDYAIAPRVKSDFGSLVWYQSQRHNVPLPSPAQDLYLYDGVDAAADANLSLPELRARLRATPMLSTLLDEHLDQLAADARGLRFAAGETLIDSGLASLDLLVLTDGTAELTVTAPDGARSTVSELYAPESIGVLESPTTGGVAAVVALTDCEVIKIDATTSSEIASRNAEVATVFNRLASVRKRRIDRVAEQLAKRA
ncbi:MAG: mechanosensitive ion channel domain-containing protein [Acidimicrobiales bacterium]